MTHSATRFLWAAVGVWALAAVVWIQLLQDGLPVAHGSGRMNPEPFRRSIALWLTLGSFGLIALGKALQDGLPVLHDALGRGTDRAWAVALSLLATTLALYAHLFLYQGLPVTQDASVYRFASEILATGRLYLDSMPDRMHYSSSLVVNDGRWYTQYFLGWPAMMTPFTLMGLPGLANPVYFGLGVPAFFVMFRGRKARLAALWFATAPLCVLAAGGGLSHTSNLTVLCWVAALSFRSRGARAGAMIGFLFCVAFFTRPTTALGLGTPFLLTWLWRNRTDAAAVAGFVLPCVVMAALFLATNAALTGSPTLVPYQRYVEFSAESDFKFTSVRRTTQVANFRFDAWRTVVIPLEGLFRLNFASLGWPFTLVFAALALRKRSSTVWVTSLVGMLAIHCMLDATGIDLFGPVHVLEAVLPLIALVTLACARLYADGHHWALGAAVAGTLVSPVLYAPVRAQNIHANAVNHHRMLAMADPLDTPAVVLVEERGFIHKCQHEKLRMRHSYPPLNPVGLDAPVLWLNRLGPQADREFVDTHYPDRTAYRLVWRHRCTPVMEPL